MPRPLKSVDAVQKRVGNVEKRVQSLSAAACESERALLVSLRGMIAKELDAGVPAHALAPLSRRLIEIDKEIRLLDERVRHESAAGVGDGSWDSRAL